MYHLREKLDAIIPQIVTAIRTHLATYNLNSFNQSSFTGLLEAFLDFDTEYNSLERLLWDARKRVRIIEMNQPDIPSDVINKAVGNVDETLRILHFKRSFLDAWVRGLNSRRQAIVHERRYIRSQERAWLMEHPGQPYVPCATEKDYNPVMREQSRERMFQAGPKRPPLSEVDQDSGEAATTLMPRAVNAFNAFLRIGPHGPAILKIPLQKFVWLAFELVYHDIGAEFYVARRALLKTLQQHHAAMLPNIKTAHLVALDMIDLQYMDFLNQTKDYYDRWFSFVDPATQEALLKRREEEFVLRYRRQARPNKPPPFGKRCEIGWRM